MSSENETKKAQISLFMILGLVLILMGGFTIYLLQFSQGNNQNPSIFTQEEVSDEVKPVQKFIISCITSVATEGIFLLGEHGGYIELNNSEYTQVPLHVNVQEPTDGDLLEMVPGYHVPYWGYMDSKNTCRNCHLSTGPIPSKQAMEEQINLYLTKNLPQCFQNFTKFEEQGMVITVQGEMVSQTTITDQAVNIILTYPLTVQSAQATSTLNSYQTALEIPLGEMYLLAKQMTEQVLEEQFLEHMLLTLISGYSGLDAKKLPPIAAFNEGYGVVYWVQPQVKNQLQSLLKSYVPLLQVEHTNGASSFLTTNAYEEQLYSSLLLKNTNAYDAYSVHFIYLDWPIYLKVTPTAGELLGPKINRHEFPYQLVPTIQLNTYEFFYDVSFPVVIEIKTENDNAQDFTFVFALEGNIRDNIGMMDWYEGKGTIGAWDYNAFTYSLNSWADTSYQVGVDSNNQSIFGEFSEPAKRFFCEPSQRISAPATVQVYDAVTHAPIQGAALVFSCGAYESCPLGSSSAKGEYVGTLPVCVGGSLSAQASGYAQASTPLNTSVTQSTKSILLLYPLEEINISMRLIRTEELASGSSAASLHLFALPPAEGQHALFSLKRIQDSAYDPTFERIVALTENVSQTTLIPGVYAVEAVLMDDNGVFISEQTQELYGEEIVYPEMNMTPAMIGGVHLTQETGYVSIPSEQLYSSDELIFYVLRMDPPQNISELSELGQFVNYSKVYRSYLDPEWR